jgi:hypothetical protein
MQIEGKNSTGVLQSETSNKNGWFRVNPQNKNSILGGGGPMGAIMGNHTSATVGAGSTTSFGGTMSLKDILSPNFNLNAVATTTTKHGNTGSNVQ